MTSGGIFGTIRELDDDAVELEIAPGVVIRVARARRPAADPRRGGSSPATPTSDPADDGTAGA